MNNLPLLQPIENTNVIEKRYNASLIQPKVLTD